MKLMLAVLMAGAVLVTPSLAMEPDEAKEVLVGAWSSPSETWLFEKDGTWTQYSGGAKFVSKFELSGMPASMIRVTSVTSGKAYVFHISPVDQSSVSVFEEGKTEQVSFLTKVD